LFNFRLRHRLLAAVLVLGPAAAAGASLDEALAAMDRGAAVFRDMSAKIKRVEYTAVIKLTGLETGAVLMKRAGTRDMRMLLQFGEPNTRSVAFEKTTARIYEPRVNTVQIFDLGKQRSLVDQFLLLGFGSTSQELKGGYQLKALGEEEIGGETVTHLELVPRSASMLQNVKKVHVWLSRAGYPLQQKFDLPSGDYQQFTYSELKINTGLADDAVRLKLPAGVKLEYPGR
jgi:outer membrane lipoprotein-sorting protein